MTRAASILAGGALVALIACGGKKGGDMPKPAPSLTVTMRAVTDDALLLADNANAFGTDSIRQVIRDSIAFKQVWERAVSRSSSKPERPAIDFNKEMVVLAAAGRMKPGDVIHIDSVGTKGSLTVVVIRTTIACQSIATSAYPFELARVPKNNGDDTFREHVMRAPECQ
jgi:hypothetical protein